LIDAQGRLPIHLRDNWLHFRFVLERQQLLFSRRGGRWRRSLPHATVTLARKPPSTGELLAPAIPRLHDVFVVVYGGVNIGDGYLVPGFDVARGDEV
jgi:hypothetical protein